VPDIHIKREHTLGLPEARKIAFKWAEMAEEKFDMECTYEEGKTEDLVTFTRSGVNGELKVTKDRFELDARLGFLLGAFKDRIEGEIVKNLDTLLARTSAAKKKPPPRKRRDAPRRPVGPSMAAHSYNLARFDLVSIRLAVACAQGGSLTAAARAAPGAGSCQPPHPRAGRRHWRAAV
jgi:putative polyhydroxyalkanoate system protein